jgi:AcrR family transcriptional regulator
MNHLVKKAMRSPARSPTMTEEAKARPPRTRSVPKLLPGAAKGAGNVPRRGLKRAEKSQANRTMLIRAAADVVGELGYDQASISRIVERAGLAQGTFYLYFESRQDLFDVLLPELTVEIMQYVHDRVHGSEDFFELEERGIKAFFDVVSKHPGLFRIINEAQAAAPKAFAKHIEEVTGPYEQALLRGVAAGQLPSMEAKECSAIAYMLIGARNHLYLWYTTCGTRTALTTVIKMYMDFVHAALSSERAPR